MPWIEMVIAYLGTKGGTGTTTLAVNGAADLRRLTRRPTAVVDLKAGPGDVALFLGLRPHHTVLDLIDLGAWHDPGALARMVSEHDSGLHVIAAGSDFSRPGPRDAEGVERLLGCLDRLYEYVVVDAGCALTPPTATALQAAHVVLLVANPDVPCLRNLQRLIDGVRLAGVPPERLRIVLNRASELGVLSTTQIEKVLGLPIAFSLNSDYRTAASAVNSGVPVSTLRASELHAQLDALARSLSASATTVAPK